MVPGEDLFHSLHRSILHQDLLVLPSLGKSGYLHWVTSCRHVDEVGPDTARKGDHQAERSVVPDVHVCPSAITDLQQVVASLQGDRLHDRMTFPNRTGRHRFSLRVELSNHGVPVRIFSKSVEMKLHVDLHRLDQASMRYSMNSSVSMKYLFFQHHPTILSGANP